MKRITSTCNKALASNFSFTPCFSWVSGTVGNLLKPFERFLRRRGKPLKRFREFASTAVTYLKIGVNKKRARQREVTLVISTIWSTTILIAVLALPLAVSGQTGKTSRTPGVLLEDLSWMEAEKLLTPDTIIVIPLGAAAKEHGPHLKLKNDWTIAEYLKNRVLQQSRVVVAPTINYHFYPAFVEYPGSTTLRLETARDLVVDICLTLSRFGPRRFYVLNTGISTLRALKPTADLLAAEGIVLHYTDLKDLSPVEKTISKQKGGTHADEIETSIMLYIAPASVDMKKAVRDYHGDSVRGGLTRDPKGQGVYSPTGIWGDPTLATRAKGKKVTEALVTQILNGIENLRRTPLSERPRNNTRP